MRSCTRITLVVLAAAAALAPSLAQAPATAPPTPNLYDRLGGLYPIAAVVDDFIDRVYVNATFNANPNIAKARTEVRKAGLKVQVANQVCMVTGGPCKYTGRGMKESHAHLYITEKEWGVMVTEFKKSLARFKVPVTEQQELFDIVGKTKGDIVAPATAGK